MKYYLVTVGGCSMYVNPPDATVTLAIKLNDFETIPEWFSHKPSFYFRTDMRATSLLGFWECTEADFDRMNSDDDDEDDYSLDTVEADKLSS